MKVRHARYREAWEDPIGPVLHKVPYEDLFVEPFYQLFRLQLLARAMEKSHELDAERVRLVYAAPSRNEELWSRLQRDAFRRLRRSDGQLVNNLAAAWHELLSEPDRYVLFDTAHLVAGFAPTSREFRSRYGHLKAGDE